MFALKKVIKQLEESAKGNSQKAGSSTDPDHKSVVAKLNSEIARAKAENASQQNVFSRKIYEMARANDETFSKYVAQTNTLHAEFLRFQNRQENSSEARCNQDVSAPNPKREVSVASTARSMSPGTTQVIPGAIERMEQRISGLSERSTSQMKEYPAIVLAKSPLEVDRSLGELRMNPMTGMTTLTIASTAQTATSLKESLRGKVMTLPVRRTEAMLGLT